jgi:xanthine dehydrogenase accessory factor
MYDIAMGVAACLRAGTNVDVAWVVATQGFSSRTRAEAMGLTPGGGRLGSILFGSVDYELADLAASGATGRLIDVRVADVDATAAGLSCGGNARCLLIPAAELPGELWDLLREREPVCLVSRLDGDRVVDTELFSADTIGGADEGVARLFARGASDAAVSADQVTTVLWPTPTLVIAGVGEVADALKAAAGLLGWEVQVTGDVGTATGLIAGLAKLDKVVVISHDHEFAGPALAAALSTPVGYIGALGSRHTQQGRADWLAYRGITDLSRIHGPAGLDIGADTPAEIAVSILAEALAVRSRSSVGSLREKSGAIH